MINFAFLCCVYSLVYNSHMFFHCLKLIWNLWAEICLRIFCFVNHIITYLMIRLKLTSYLYYIFFLWKLHYFLLTHLNYTSLLLGYRHNFNISILVREWFFINIIQKSKKLFSNTKCTHYYNMLWVHVVSVDSSGYIYFYCLYIYIYIYYCCI